MFWNMSLGSTGDNTVLDSVHRSAVRRQNNDTSGSLARPAMAHLKWNTPT